MRRAMEHAIRRTSGRISVGGIVLLAVLLVAAYFGLQYLPVISQKARGGDIARNAAAKMVIEPNDYVIREFIQEQAKQKGLTIPPSQIAVRRNHPQRGMYTVELKWNHQIKHVWGKTKVVNLHVAETADTSGGKVLKNAL